MQKQNTSGLFIDFMNLKDSAQYHANSLALTLCKKLIEQMGGVLKLNTRGNTFKVTFQTACDLREEFNDGSDRIIGNNKSISSISFPSQSERVSHQLERFNIVEYDSDGEEALENSD